MGISIQIRQIQGYQKYLNNYLPSLAMESQGISLAALLAKSSHSGHSVHGGHGGREERYEK
jgi:hypothetical protein